MYSKITHSIKIVVSPQFLEEHSSPQERLFIWTYHIRIENLSQVKMQLKARHWRITDSNGYIRDVFGEGVVGEQPTLYPGDFYEYTSGIPLPTPSGIMHGSYKMLAEDGDILNVEIPIFSLDSPYEHKTVH